jgi:predicted TPR repeat methyltransferase
MRGLALGKSSAYASIAMLNPDDDRDLDPEQPMSLEDAVLLGTRFQRLGEFDAARGVYRAVLEAAPEHVDALHFLGILEHQCHNDQLAFELLQRALQQRPDLPGMHQNIGNILLELNRMDEAADAYTRCAQLGGRSAELLNNIATMRRIQRDFVAAEAFYLEALALDPECVDALSGYGSLLAGLGRVKEAMEKCVSALVRERKNPIARAQLGRLLIGLGRAEEAAAIYREWLELEPDSPTARHYFLACTGASLPRAPDAYVVATFDRFAQSFDAKLEALRYRAPELVGEALRKQIGAPSGSLDILDAGCGTGLCQRLLRPFARQLVGVDLSLGMLQKAKQRGGYDLLAQGELTAFIAQHQACFDVVASADTLCYFGALEEVCAATQRALRPGGSFFFTVEELEPATEHEAAAGVKLLLHGRFSHSRAHVRAALLRAGFAEPSFEQGVLRFEVGEPVRGLIVSASRA